MKNLVFTLSFISFFLINSLFAQSDAELIQSTLMNQEKAWNSGNIEEYMEGYWKSDSLKFMSINGVKTGWQSTIDSYKKGYPTQKEMGKLTFGIVSVDKIDFNTYLLIGTWNLEREEIENQGGYFSLLWKKKNGKWVIVVDHTS